MNEVVLTLDDSGLQAAMQGRILTCRSDGGDMMIAGSAVNRTGIYKLVKIPFNGQTLNLELTVK